MAQPKNLRAHDQGPFAEGRKDFFARKHGLSKKELACASIAVVLGVAFLVYNKSLIGSTACLLVGIVLYIVARQIERHRKALQATEFLNALFSSALAESYKFCVVVKQDDGQIVYLDRSFQKIFPDMVPKPKRMLEDLLVTYGTSDAERGLVIAASQKDAPSELPIKIQSGDDKQVGTMLFSIEPIKRPAGFALVRGR